MKHALPSPKFLASLVTLILTAVILPAADPVLQKGDRLAIVGDSITEQKLYSKFIETYILACMPQLEVQCLQFGWGGERAPGFANRMDNDLVPWKPDVVTTCYGMNDGEYREYEERIGRTYEEGMRRIIDRMKEIGAQVVVGSPGVVDSQTWASREPDRDKVYNDNLNHLRGIARDLARENGFPFADVFGAMMHAMAEAKETYGDDYHVGGGDGIHPASNGHLTMAYAFLKGLGFDGDLGTVVVDMKSGEARAENGHRVLESAGGTVGLESTRYPFCFYGEDKDPNGTRSILPFVPFNQDLNRFTLRVDGLTSAQAEVTWGETSKTFTREQLTQGINLAAEFLNNPFVEPFMKVMDAVRDKQNYETPMIKDQINRFRFYDRAFENDAEVEAALGVLRAKLVARDDELHRAAKETVQPVRHEIVIRPL